MTAKVKKISKPLKPRKGELVISDEFMRELFISFSKCREIIVRSRRGTSYHTSWKYVLRWIREHLRYELSQAAADGMNSLIQMERDADDGMAFLAAKIIEAVKS